MLKPAFRMLDVTAYGVLQGTIAAATVGTSLDPATNNCASDDKVDFRLRRKLSSHRNRVENHHEVADALEPQQKDSLWR